MSIQLSCMDGTSLDDAMMVVRHCLKVSPIKFDRVTIFHGDTNPPVIDGIDLITISKDDCNPIWTIADHIVCDHVLAVHWDGFIVNPSAWKDSFLDYDWIGAAWRLDNLKRKDWRVGNGGFCIYTRRIAELWANRIHFDVPHDWDICAINRDQYERDGCTFAPVELATQFSKECDLEDIGIPEGSTFGFHGYKYHPRERLEYARKVFGNDWVNSKTISGRMLRELPHEFIY